MVTGVVGVVNVLLWGIFGLVADVECSWAWEWDRDNYSPINRHSRIPHVGVRRSIYDRFWGETTPNNPFLPTRPSAPRILPRLSENDFIVGDDDYDKDLRNAHWFPQTHHSGQQTLEDLQHLLEGKLGPINDPTPVEKHKTPVRISHKDEKEKKQRTKQIKYRQRFGQDSAPSSPDADRSSSSAERGEGLAQIPDFGTGDFAQDGRLMADDQQFSKDILQDFQEPLSMQEHFTNSKQFPKDFISPEQLPRDFGVQETPSNDHLTTDPFVSELENQNSPFQEHILLSPLSNSDFQNPDHLLNLHSDQALSEVDLPQIFPDLGLLRNIDQQGSFLHQDGLGHFDMANSQSPDILPETGEGLEWLPPSLSELNLPSHNQMISSFEQQKLSKEAHRGTRTIRSSNPDPDACHARNLHSCGSRLIDEFAFGPDNPDKCRIREEFLDCMEQVMKLPCELHGERYSREGTKLIRDKIKTLLWSAQGCILGYST
ncbi:uncharacterized protein [Palaemon carinicauda]|uniref:uncharacterized protein isoform X1 n=1 Tax=Palaemon carinicauda TaxID=392227 RepID=UPI0035B68C54